MSGIQNSGNTCYISTGLQLLCSIPEFKKILFLNKTQNEINNCKNKPKKYELIDEVIKIIKIIGSDSNANNAIKHKPLSININKFVKLLVVASNSNFEYYQQADAVEFMIFILNTLHEIICKKVKVNINVSDRPKTEIDNLAIKCYTMISDTYKNEYSVLYDLFYGIQLCKNKNTKTGITEIVPVFFNELNLNIPQKYISTISNKNNKQMPAAQIRLEQCFDDYVKSVKIVDTATTTTTLIQTHRFWSFPHILIIKINRFSNDTQKNLQPIVCPVTLNLKKYVDGYNADNYIYNLQGIGYHDGSSANHGHYTCAVRNENNSWTYFNDEQVYNNAVIENLLGLEVQPFISILVYSRGTRPPYPLEKKAAAKPPP